MASNLSIGSPGFRATPLQTSPKMVVTSFLDGTEENLEPLVARSVEDFQRSVSDAHGSLAVTADLYRAGSKLEEKKHHHWVQQAVNTGFALLSSACLAIGLDAGFYGLETYRLYNEAKNGETANEKESLWAHQRLQGGDWAGHKTFKFDGQQNLLAAADQTSESRPDAKLLKQHLIENHRQWPSSTSVVHTFGHGGGVQGLCGVSMQEFSGALNEAAQETGKKADVVLFESCLMGNLETMAAISDGAKFAIASEKKLDFPVPKKSVEKRLLDPENYVELSQKDLGSEDLSKAMFDAAAQQPVVQQTLARYDLTELKTGLLPSIGTLGTALGAELEKDGSSFAKLVSDALDKTAVVDPNLAFVDLGSFLENLQESVTERPAVTTAISDALAHLESSVPQAKSAEADEARQLHHLSFVDPRVFFKKPDGEAFDFNGNLPEGWQQFSKSLQTSLTEMSKGETPNP